jgi:alpha-methylacyl-CoA racemase
VLEFSGLGPTPFAAMMLADMGADILRIDRPDKGESLTQSKGADTLFRGRPSLTLDLKDRDQAAAARALARHADVVVEGYRPGVMEHLGLGPDVLFGDHPALIYARITGWGQKGPLARSAGHDINYISLTGALLAIGTEGEPPPPPLNLLGDFGAGGMMAVAGILAALVERQSSGRGQVVDAAMVDGTALLLAQVASLRMCGLWSERRGANLLDGGSYFYRCYRCADGGFVAVGALESKFHDAFIERLGLDPADFPDRLEPRHWPERAGRIAAIFAREDRAFWERRFDGTDACVTPVLSMDDAPAHPANSARAMHVDTSPAAAPSAAPRFSRTPSSVRPEGEAVTAAALRGWNVPEELLQALTGSA